MEVTHRKVRNLYLHKIGSKLEFNLSIPCQFITQKSTRKNKERKKLVRIEGGEIWEHPPSFSTTLRSELILDP